MPHDSASSWLLRTVSWLLLAGWFGSFCAFAIVVAPTAFRVLPSHDLAGELVSPVLAALHNFGILAGLAVAALGWMTRRGTVAILLPLALSGLCAGSEYLVTPAIAAVEPAAFGPATHPDAAARFAELHQTSRLLFGLVSLGVGVLIGLHARDTAGHPGSSAAA